MDYTIIYALGITICSIAIVIGGVYLYNKLPKKQQEQFDKILKLTIVVGEIAFSVAEDMNIKDKDKISKIRTVVTDSLNYVSKSTGILSIEQKKIMTLEYALKLSKECNLEITQERKDLIKQMIELSYDTVPELI